LRELVIESACGEKKAQLLAGRENDPGRVELRRQDLSRIFDGHPGEGGDGGGELGALGGPSILAADEAYYDAQAHHNSDHHSENEAHRESVKKRDTRGLVLGLTRIRSVEPATVCRKNK